MLTHIRHPFLFTTIYNVGLLFFLTVCYVHCYCCTIVFPWEYLCRVALTYLNLLFVDVHNGIDVCILGIGLVCLLMFIACYLPRLHVDIYSC